MNNLEIKWSYNNFTPKLSSNHEINEDIPFFGVYIENDKSEVIAYLTIRILDVNPITEKVINKKYELLNFDVLSVDKNYQNLGLGTKLLETALDFALPNDIVYIWPMSKISKHILDKINDNRIVRNLKDSINKAEKGNIYGYGD